MPGPEEKRQAPRVPIELRVDYRKMNTFFADYTKNISKGGTFIKTDKPLEIGTSFVFKLMVPLISAPVELHGEVRWIRNPGDPPDETGDDTPGMGIRFIYESDEERGRFESLVERMMRESLGDHLYEKLLGRS
jgi:type IV pilus assembly protein PilZ